MFHVEFVFKLEKSNLCLKRRNKPEKINTWKTWWGPTWLNRMIFIMVKQVIKIKRLRRTRFRTKIHRNPFIFISDVSKILWIRKFYTRSTAYFFKVSPFFQKLFSDNCVYVCYIDIISDVVWYIWLKIMIIKTRGRLTKSYFIIFDKLLVFIYITR